MAGCRYDGERYEAYTVISRTCRITCYYQNFVLYDVAVSKNEQNGVRCTSLPSRVVVAGRFYTEMAVTLVVQFQGRQSHSTLPRRVHSATAGDQA